MPSATEEFEGPDGEVSQACDPITVHCIDGDCPDGVGVIAIQDSKRIFGVVVESMQMGPYGPMGTQIVIDAPSARKLAAALLNCADLIDGFTPIFTGYLPDADEPETPECGNKDKKKRKKK